MPPQDRRRQRDPHPFHVRTVSLQGMKLMLEGGPTARLDNCEDRRQSLAPDRFARDDRRGRCEDHGRRGLSKDG